MARGDSGHVEAVSSARVGSPDLLEPYDHTMLNEVMVSEGFAHEYT